MKKPWRIAPIALAAVALVGCSKVSAGEQAVEVDSWGSPEVSGCVKEETQVSTWTVDLVRYPARDVTWDASSDPNADPERGPYEVLSKDQVYMLVPLTVQTDLTQDCELLKQFHRDLGVKYQAWLDENGQTTENWNTLLNFVVGEPTNQTLIAITNKYDYGKIWSDQAVREEYRNALQSQLEKAALDRTGKEYFTNFRVTIGNPVPADQRIRDNKANEQAAISEANTRQIQASAEAKTREETAKANENAANAEAAAAEALARKRAAEIAGYGTGPGAVDAWLRDRELQIKESAVERGINPFPSPIIPGVG